MGKRQIGELQPSEFVIAILISNIATLSIEDTDIPFLGAVVPIIVLMCCEVILSYITLKSGKAQKIVSGSPVIVVQNGKPLQKNMRDLRFSIEDLMSQLRICGVFDVREVALAVVETNGKLSVFPKYEARPVTPQGLQNPVFSEAELPPMVLISDGVIVEHTLSSCSLTEKWLENVLRENGVAPRDVFLMTCDNAAKYYIVKKEVSTP